MKQRRERGAIVVEATISLSAFIFAIFLILSIVRIYSIQARMSVALNTAAKELSQYSYLYFKFGADQLEQDLNKGTEEARATATQTADGLSEVMRSLGAAGGNLESGNFDDMVKNLETGGEAVDSLITMYGEKIADDPKGLIIGMGKMAGNDLKETAKAKLLGQILGKALMKKNLKAFPEDDAESFLRRYRVVDGMKGLDFNYTVILPYGQPDIQLVATYEVEVLRLLNIDFKFQFRQMAKTKAWGNGVSGQPETKAEPDPDGSIWDLPSDVKRGEYIVDKEKGLLQYKASGHGYDGYEKSGDKERFLSISSVNTHMESYQKEGAIGRKLSGMFGKMYAGVPDAGEEFTVTNSAGTTETLKRGTEEPVYRLVLVVPDDADLAAIRQEAKAFEQKEAGLGYTVEVEIKTGYGSPSEKKP